MSKCPGRMTPRNLDSVLVPCPDCGRKVEFFTDEVKRECRCGRVLLRETLPQCAEWCPAADRCLGKAVDSRLRERRARADKNLEAGKAHVEEIRKQVRGKESHGRKTK